MLTQTKYLPILLLAVAFGCKNNNKPSEITENKPVEKQDTVIKKITEKEIPVSIALDTAEVLAAFKAFSQTEQFFNVSQIKKDNGDLYNSERPILIGDLNGDGLDDAIMPFTIEGRGGGNNWDTHYAIFINTDKKLEYKSTFDRGADSDDMILHFKSIKKGVISGLKVNNDNLINRDDVPVKYAYKSGSLVKLEK